MARAVEAPSEALAVRVMELARAELLVEYPFFAGALGAMPFVIGRPLRPYAADGAAIVLDAERIVERFRATEQLPVHDLLHIALHYVLLHPFEASGRDERLWNLACDICVERIVMRVCGLRDGAEGAEIAGILSQVETRFSGSISAQRLYRALVGGTWEGS